MFYLNLSYRDMEERLLASEAVCQALELPQAPDYSPLQRTRKKPRMVDLEGWRGNCETQAIAI